MSSAWDTFVRSGDAFYTFGETSFGTYMQVVSERTVPFQDCGGTEWARVTRAAQDSYKQHKELRHAQHKHIEYYTTHAAF